MNICWSFDQTCHLHTHLTLIQAYSVRQVCGSALITEPRNWFVVEITHGIPPVLQQVTGGCFRNISAACVLLPGTPTDTPKEI